MIAAGLERERELKVGVRKARRGIYQVDGVGTRTATGVAHMPCDPLSLLPPLSLLSLSFSGSEEERRGSLAGCLSEFTVSLSTKSLLNPNYYFRNQSFF